MDLSKNFIVTNFSTDREKKILHYIRNNPNCSINKVIVYCRDNGGPPKETVEKTIAKLIEDGIVTERPNPNDKRAFMLTVESENLLETLPMDLENIFSKLLTFTKLVKKMIENNYSVGDKPPPNYISAIVTYEAKKDLPFLPYYVTSIINSLYTFYFVFILPQKIENRNLIAKLHSWYFENLSKIYTFFLCELGNTDYYSNDIAVMVKSKINLGYSEVESLGLNSVIRIVRVCRFNDIEKELYKVLDQLWIRNEYCCTLMYELNEEKKTPNRNLLNQEQITKINDIKYLNHLRKDKILAKIHTMIDLSIFFQEEAEA